MDALVDLDSESPKPRGMRAEVQIMVFDNVLARVCPMFQRLRLS